MKKRLLTVLLIAVVSTVVAQDCGLTGRLYGVVGHSYSEDFYGAMAAVADYRADSILSLTGGIEFFRSRGYAATAAWQCRLPWPNRNFFLYNRYLYRLFACWNTNEYSSHTALGFDSRHWRATLGLASRFMSPVHPYDRTGSTEYVFEPFNVMYELQYRFTFGRDDRWNMALRVADFDDFVTDRAYQPIFSLAAGRLFGHSLTAYARTACYPTGMFSLSANYYELFFNFGLQKKW